MIVLLCKQAVARRMRAADNASVAVIWIADAAQCFWYSDGTGPAFYLV